MSLPRLLSLAQAAEYLDAGEGHVTPRYVGDLIKSGRLAGVKVSNRYRVSEDALAAFVESGGCRRTPAVSPEAQGPRYLLRTRRPA